MDFVEFNRVVYSEFCVDLVNYTEELVVVEFFFDDIVVDAVDRVVVCAHNDFAEDFYEFSAIAVYFDKDIDVSAVEELVADNYVAVSVFCFVV